MNESRVILVPNVPWLKSGTVKDNILFGSAYRDELYKNRSSRKIYSRRLFSREYDFPKTFSLTENQFSGKTYFYTIAYRKEDYDAVIDACGLREDFKRLPLKDRVSARKVIMQFQGPRSA